MTTPCGITGTCNCMKCENFVTELFIEHMMAEKHFWPDRYYGENNTRGDWWNLFGKLMKKYGLIHSRNLWPEFTDWARDFKEVKDNYYDAYAWGR